MRDLALIGFLAAIVALGFRRPFILVLAYLYVDIVTPQRLSYYLLNSAPVSLIAGALAVGGWLLAEDKKGMRVSMRQWMILILLIYAYFTTINADFPIEAKAKWDWASKTLIWAFFVPLALTTRLRIEAYLLIAILSLSSIVIVGGIKTLVSGGGYGTLVMFVDNNSGLLEGSTIAAAAITVIPLILWFTKYGTIFPPDWRVKVFAYSLIFACLLIPVGTAARTGVLCIGALLLLMLRYTKRRLMYLGLVGLAGLAAIPMLPESFTSRTATISTYQADNSANTRIAVWMWTINYVNEHPFGGGFEAYLQNRLSYDTVKVQTDGTIEEVQTASVKDVGRAYHSSYFEMLGEQGYPGLILFLLIQGIGLLQMEILRRRYKESKEEAWLSPLATALQSSHLIYLVGSAFIGVAYQAFTYLLVAVEIGLWSNVSRREKANRQQRALAPRSKPGFADPAKPDPLPSGAVT